MILSELARTPWARRRASRPANAPRCPGCGIPRRCWFRRLPLRSRADGARELRVAPRLAGRDRQQRIPDGTLKRRAGRRATAKPVAVRSRERKAFLLRRNVVNGSISFLPVDQTAVRRERPLSQIFRTLGTATAARHIRSSSAIFSPSKTNAQRPLPNLRSCRFRRARERESAARPADRTCRPDPGRCSGKTQPAPGNTGTESTGYSRLLRGTLVASSGKQSQ
jgi:hypothetical protein